MLNRTPLSTRLRRTAFGSIALTAALGASVLVAAPASAAADLSGVVLDQGAPVADVDVELYRADGSGWDYIDDVSSDSSGAWTLPAPSDDGDYALFYYLDSTLAAAPFAASQGWDGAVDDDDLTTQFTVSGGNASTTSFSQTLLHNAGIVAVHQVDALTGTPITGDSTGGYSQVQFYDGYSETDGWIDSGVYYAVSYEQVTGTATVGHVLPASYFSGYTYANSPTTSYSGELLDPFTVSVGATTEITARLYPSGTPSVNDVLPNNYEPKITGVAKVGSLLSVAPISTTATLTYQWWTESAPIAGATSATFTLTPKQLGQPVYVRVIARQAGYTSNDRWSDYTKPVAVGDPNAITVAITGSATFGGTLTAQVGNPLGGTKEFQWYRNGAPIAGADGSSYTVVKADVAQSLFVSVKSTAQGHSDAVSPSAAVVVAKDAAKVTVTTKATITTKTKTKVTVKLTAGASKLSSTGTVRVYYTSTKYKTAKIASGKSKSVTLPKLTKGTKSIKVVYLGNGSYAAKTVVKKVKVVKK